MTTKTFELTIEERNILVRVLEHVMETNANCNMEYEGVNHTYVWSTKEAEQEQKELQALYLKLMPKSITKSGWVLKERLVGEVWQALPAEDTSDFQFITWEEQE